MKAKLIKLETQTIDGYQFSHDCKIDFSRVKVQGVITHNFDQKPIGKFGDIKLIGDEYFVDAIVPVSAEGEKLIQISIKNGLLRAYPAGKIIRSLDGKVTEFKVYEVSISGTV